MQLNKNHRESLLTELVKAKDEIDLGKAIANSKQAQQQTDDFKDWQDIKLFLLEERVKLIEKSLIDNEIDF